MNQIEGGDITIYYNNEDIKNQGSCCQLSLHCVQVRPTRILHEWRGPCSISTDKRKKNIHCSQIIRAKKFIIYTCNRSISSE